MLHNYHDIKIKKDFKNLSLYLKKQFGEYRWISIWTLCNQMDFINYFTIFASMDTEMCCPKGKCGGQYFILLTLKKVIHGHRGPGFF